MTLTQFFKDHPKAAVAFSGGVDSAFLLYAAKASGAEVAAYYVKTPFQPKFELEDAEKLARLLSLPMKVLPLDILSLEAVTANPADRCYHCKKAIFTAISQAAAADGYSLLLDGTNASDEEADRPGFRALRELAVLSPLRLCGLTKAEIRRLSREAGLFTHAKPAYACLATRIPTGQAITAQALAATEAAENYLASLGFRDFRVRCSGGQARVQLRESDLPLLLQHRQSVLDTFKQYYSGVVLDLEVRNEF